MNRAFGAKNSSVSRFGSLPLLFFSAISGFAAAPTITSVGNAASNYTFSSPIAQGAIFVIKGSGLGPASISVASTPFQSTTLSGSSVSVTVGATTVNALMYYTSDGQVAALLPSNTPTGVGTFTVTYNGQASNAYQHGIATSNLGIFTLDSTGEGPGIVTYASDYSLVSAAKAANCGGPATACGAANPGDTLILWGTGLGPVNGNDASGAGLGQNMPNVPLTVWVGGVQAQVLYQGRSSYIGLDQIAFVVPANTPTGCAVPLVAQIGTNANTISNTTALPVANGSRSCTPTNPALAGINVEQAVMAGPVTYGDIKLAHYSDGGGTFEDDAKLQFLKLSAFNPGSQPFFLAWVDDPPLGTCTVFDNLNMNESSPITGLALLDAGSSATVTGPNGNVQLPVTGKGASFNAQGTFLVPGAYTIAGSGGADVAAFTANVTMPAAPTLVTPINNGSATRANGMMVTWNGGTGNVQIVVNGPLDNTYTNGRVAFCTAAASAGTFTIPPYVLLALPPSNPPAFSSGFILTSVTKTPFSASGLGAGVVEAYSDFAGSGWGWGSGGFTLK
jgi:uncharacterized protein (TIGR03437 family)